MERNSGSLLLCPLSESCRPVLAVPICAVPCSNIVGSFDPTSSLLRAYGREAEIRQQRPHNLEEPHESRLEARTRPSRLLEYSSPQAKRRRSTRACRLAARGTHLLFRSSFKTSSMVLMASS